MAQLVERVLGKDEVSSSNLDSSSKSRVTLDTAFCFVYWFYYFFKAEKYKCTEKYIYFSFFYC